MGGGAKIQNMMTKLIFSVFFQIFQNFSIYKLKKILWHDFGAPLRAAPGGRCPPLPPPRYATVLLYTVATKIKDVQFVYKLVL